MLCVVSMARMSPMAVQMPVWSLRVESRAATPSVAPLRPEEARSDG